MAMPTSSLQPTATRCRVKFSPGDVVVCRATGKRGVVIEVDEVFCGPEDAFRALTSSRRGPKRSPWYHVLVEGDSEAQYVAECHISLDNSGRPVSHPLIESVFTDFAEGRYIRLNH
jgi:heat shock protein HspQ